MELGSLQKQWIESLRANPERQMSDELGRGNSRIYRACCLGELHICYHRKMKKKIPFIKGQLVDIDPIGGRNRIPEEGLLSFSYEKYGLRDDTGSLLNSVRVIKGSKKIFSSLAEMNDGGWSWLEIADYIEKNPENVFKKSV